MAKNIRTVSMLPTVDIDPRSPQPLYRQIYESLRKSILSQQLLPGTRLPSTRDLAELLSVSRNTIKNAFEQLIAEGYLEAAVGSGTYVSKSLPTEFFEVDAQQESRTLTNRFAGSRLSSRSEQWEQYQVVLSSQVNRDYAFRNGIPALDKFPFDLWSRLTARCYRNLPLSLFDQPEHSAGYMPLREAIANYLNIARGARCTAEQVIITTGTQQALFAAAQLLVDVGDTIWMEDPGYLGARSAFMAAGAKIVPIPVDEQGLDVEHGIATAAHARLVYTTPSHQFPYGSTLSLNRRLLLINWAAQQNAWILEDDYNSEYRYVGHPLSCLQGLDTANRVIYMGSFNKVLFPALRIGYAVVPSHLVERFQSTCALINGTVPTLIQAVLAEFIKEGHFYQHIRKMRALYANRRSIFVDAVEYYCANALTLGPIDAGLHVVGWLSEKVLGSVVTQQARLRGLETLAIDLFYMGRNHPPGLVLGFNAIPDERIAAHVETLSKAIAASR